MHFLVHFAEVLVIFSRLEAHVVAASLYFDLLELVLSEVETLLREQFLAYRQVEVFVGNLSVFVHVEVAINLFEVCVVDLDAPEVEVKF